MQRRPISVTLLACLYLAVGALGFAAHFHSLLAHQPDAWAIELTELLALVIAIFLLLGHNWARWLALVWMAFHVAISLHQPRQLAMHSVLLVLFAWILFSAAARRWFRPSSADRAA
jgi:hypothetical protein